MSEILVSPFQGLTSSFTRIPRALPWGTALACVLTAVFIPRIPINNQFVDWFDESIPIRQDTEYAMEHLTGIYHLTFSLGVRKVFWE